jgi:hypothetical protein
MQTNEIDCHSNFQQIDIYDLKNARDQGTSPPRKSFLREVKDASVGADLTKRLLAPRDWFYSKLFRQLIQQKFFKRGAPLPS